VCPLRLCRLPLQPLEVVKSTSELLLQPLLLHLLPGVSALHIQHGLSALHIQHGVSALHIKHGHIQHGVSTLHIQHGVSALHIQQSIICISTQIAKSTELIHANC
jgi:hypothetical protein